MERPDFHPERRHGKGDSDKEVLHQNLQQQDRNFRDQGRQQHNENLARNQSSNYPTHPSSNPRPHGQGNPTSAGQNHLHQNRHQDQDHGSATSDHIFKTQQQSQPRRHPQNSFPPRPTSHVPPHQHQQHQHQQPQNHPPQPSPSPQSYHSQLPHPPRNIYQVTHLILPFLFFVTFSIFLTTVIIYSLSLHLPLPSHFLEGIGITFAVELVVWVGVLVWIKVEKWRGDREVMRGRRRELMDDEWKGKNRDKDGVRGGRGLEEGYVGSGERVKGSFRRKVRESGAGRFFRGGTIFRRFGWWSHGLKIKDQEVGGKSAEVQYEEWRKDTLRRGNGKMDEDEDEEFPMRQNALVGNEEVPWIVPLAPPPKTHQSLERVKGSSITQAFPKIETRVVDGEIQAIKVQQPTAIKQKSIENDDFPFQNSSSTPNFWKRPNRNPLGTDSTSPNLSPFLPHHITKPHPPNPRRQPKTSTPQLPKRTTPTTLKKSSLKRTRTIPRSQYKPPDSPVKISDEEQISLMRGKSLKRRGNIKEPTSPATSRVSISDNGKEDDVLETPTSTLILVPSESLTQEQEKEPEPEPVQRRKRGGTIASIARIRADSDTLPSFSLTLPPPYKSEEDGLRALTARVEERISMLRTFSGLVFGEEFLGKGGGKAFEGVGVEEIVVGDVERKVDVEEVGVGVGNENEKDGVWEGEWKKGVVGEKGEVGEEVVEEKGARRKRGEESWLWVQNNSK